MHKTAESWLGFNKSNVPYYERRLRCQEDANRHFSRPIIIFKIGKNDRYINIRAVGRRASATAGVALQTGPIAGKQKKAGTAQLQQKSSITAYITRVLCMLWQYVLCAGLH